MLPPSDDVVSSDIDSTVRNEEDVSTRRPRQGRQQISSSTTLRNPSDYESSQSVWDDQFSTLYDRPYHLRHSRTTPEDVGNVDNYTQEPSRIPREELTRPRDAEPVRKHSLVPSEGSKTFRAGRETPLPGDRQARAPSEYSEEQEPRYVLSGQPTGWAAMASNVRSYDEELIKDCKDDVDTLMTFAGLFSAAITAFLVQAYQNLMPNTAGQTLDVLRYIAVQNTVSRTNISLPDMSNLSVLISPPQPLPTSIEISINVLWFASLITSLVSASFGMLVKQWLREYSAVSNPSSQARLRVRRARHPYLASWRVFEIAAALPLLLQLALALFFAGLCLFTSSVHSTVGRTSTSLVLSWAFCFFAATSLPAFFPRCPYKTAFLKEILHFFYGILPRFLKSSDNVDEHHIARDSTHDLDILIDVDALQADDELLGTTILESIGQVHPPTITALSNFVKRILNHRVQHSRSGEKLVTWPVNAQLQALTYRGKKAILDIIGKYVQPPPPMTSHTVHTPSLSLEDVHTSFGICAFLSSPALHPLPADCSKLLKTSLTKHSTDVITALVDQWHDFHSSWEHSIGTDLLSNLRSACEDLDLDLRTTMSCFQTLMYTYATKKLLVKSPQVSMYSNPDMWPWLDLLEIEDICRAGAFLCSSSTRELRQIHAVTQPHDHEAALKHAQALKTSVECALYLNTYLFDRGHYVTGMNEDLAELLAQTFTASTLNIAHPIVAACVRQSAQSFVYLMPHVLDRLRDILNDTGIRRAVVNFHAIIHYMNKISLVVPLDHYIKLSFVAVRLVSRENIQVAATDWKGLFKTLSTALSQSSKSAITSAVPQKGEPLGDDEELLAQSCLSHIDEMDVLDPYPDQAHYLSWKKSFDPSASMFGDDLVEMLYRFCFKNARARSYYRIRRLLENNPHLVPQADEDDRPDPSMPTTSTPNRPRIFASSSWTFTRPPDRAQHVTFSQKVMRQTATHSRFLMPRRGMTFDVPTSSTLPLPQVHLRARSE